MFFLTQRAAHYQQFGTGAPFLPPCGEYGVNLRREVTTMRSDCQYSQNYPYSQNVSGDADVSLNTRRSNRYFDDRLTAGDARSMGDFVFELAPPAEDDPFCGMMDVAAKVETRSMTRRYQNRGNTQPNRGRSFNNAPHLFKPVTPDPHDVRVNFGDLQQQYTNPLRIGHDPQPIIPSARMPPAEFFKGEAPPTFRGRPDEDWFQFEEEFNTYATLKDLNAARKRAVFSGLLAKLCKGNFMMV